VTDVRCFWIEPTERVRVSLRRYSRDDARCPGPYRTWHNASVVIGEDQAKHHEEGWAMGFGREPTDEERSDGRWPVKCDHCDYRFTEEDERQVNGDLIYVADDGREISLRDAEPGAMWEAPWIGRRGEGWTGPDGRSLAVQHPDGASWWIDGPAKDGGRWTRTGEPPNISVTPSILSPDYHGFLTDGVLREC
jgi:hypothetical protein